MKKKLLLSSILSIVMCFSLICGATFALFTSEDKVNIAITSGTVNVTANIDENSVKTKQLYDTDYTQGKDNMFEGVATFDEQGLTLNKLVPGDGIMFNIVVKNNSNVKIQYRTIILCEYDTGLFSGLEMSINNEKYNGVSYVGDWTLLDVGAGNAEIPVVIELPEDAENTYQDKTCTISYKVEAIQGNADTENPADDTIYIYTANDLKALSNFVATTDTVIELCSDIDMQNQEINSIVSWYTNLTFKGNNHKISNVRFERNTVKNNGGSAGDSMFYTSTDSSLTVSDLKFVNAKTEANTDGRYAAIVDSYPQGALTLNNVDVENSAVVGTKSAGVLLGHMQSSVTINDCDIKDSTVTLAACAAEPNGHYAGKVVGTIGSGATLAMNDCTVANIIVDGSLRTDNVGEIFGRNLGKLLINGESVEFASNTGKLIDLIKAAPEGEETVIYLAEGTYSDNIDITRAYLGTVGGDIVIKANEGTNTVISGTVTIGYRQQNVGAASYTSKVSFEGITFDHAEAGKHCLNVQDVESFYMVNCTVIGDGEFGLSTPGSNGTGAAKIEKCKFINAGMQLAGKFAQTAIIDNCEFEESVINVQGGGPLGPTIQNCKFDITLRQSHSGGSFYVIRNSNAGANIKVNNCEINVDAEQGFTGVAGSKGWGVFVNRIASYDINAEDVTITMTDAALAQSALKVATCLSTGKINMTNVTLNGVVQ